jgi:DinB family protein
MWYIAEIDRQRARLRKMLRSQDPRVLARRPTNGDWSIVENVRHLVFAEQLHLGGFLSDKVEWSRVGLTERTRPEFASVGTRPTNDVEKVFAEWDAIHIPIRKAMKSAGGEIQRALWRNHRHLRIHTGVIEKMLRKLGA